MRPGVAPMRGPRVQVSPSDPKAATRLRHGAPGRPERDHTMIPISYQPLAWAGIILLALTACATSPRASAAVETASPAVDLGPSSRVPATRMAMAGAGHELHGVAASNEPSSAVQPVHEGGNDA